MRPMRSTLPYGSWPSPITTRVITGHKITLSQPVLSDGILYWLEARPQEAGRTVIVRRTSEGSVPADVTPVGWDVGSRVHEYGGGAFAAQGESVWFVSDDDQRLYEQPPGRSPRALTPEPPFRRAWRYGDLVAAPDGSAIVCVRERHEAGGGHPTNDLVWISTRGGPIRVLHTGRDFYASPRLSPDGSALVFLAWDHPNMPWDGTEAWVGTLSASGVLGEPRRVAGGPTISIVQPSFSSGGVLHFLSDENGWWNPYRMQGSACEPLLRRASEFAGPAWVFGLSTMAFLSEGRIACIRSDGGHETLCVLSTRTGELCDLPLPFTSYRATLASDGLDRLVFVGSAPDRPAVLALHDVSTGRTTEVRRSFGAELGPRYLSMPVSITFPTDNGAEAHGLYYPPANGDVSPPTADRPPLLVHCHGGPTSQSTSELSLGIQYWTSRGFAVIDVNYGGSSGYGRAYRNRLAGGWGVVDRADCVNAARHLARETLVDPARIGIRGGSAGGYTALCALVSSDVFAVGCSLYGIGDLTALATHTHKFEARYLDSLVGPYPERKDLYEARSPLRALDRLRCPLIVMQGEEDRVVPREQADAIVAALRAKGLAYAYVLFAGEGHGFRRADSIVRALEAELTFYGRIFRFQPADTLPELRIENLHP
jgi:dipeptidyl aminopeptidase/acylaminoacyl peptidase